MNAYLGTIGREGNGSIALWGRLQEEGERPAGIFDVTEQNEKKVSKTQIK
jgi:hypothetical protein